MYRNKVQAAVITVNAGNKLRHLTLKLSSISGHGSGRGNLNEHNIANPLWVIVEELLKGAELNVS